MQKRHIVSCLLMVFLIITSIVFTSDPVKADTIYQAVNASPGNTYQNTVSNNNPKFYKITLDKGGMLKIDADSHEGYIYFEIYSSNGESYIDGFKTNYNDNFGFYRTRDYTTYLQAGTYYLKISSYDDNISYNFKFTYTSSNETFPEISRKDDTIPNANQLTMGKLIYGMVCDCSSANYDEVDMYKVTLRYKQTCSIEVTPYAGTNNSYISFTILDSEGNTKYSSGEAYYKDGRSAKTKIVLGKGTYYFKVTGYYYTKYKLRACFTSILPDGIKGLTKTNFNQKNGWYYIADNIVNINATGITKYNKTYYYVKNGRLTFDETGLVKGKINGKTGYWYVKNSKVMFENTLVKYKGKYYGVFNGYYNPKGNGIVKYNNAYWYVKDGKLASTFTGKVTINGKKYNIVKGKVK